MTKPNKNDPVLQLDDKYFGNLFLNSWTSSDLFHDRPKDIASNVQNFIFNPHLPKRPSEEDEESGEEDEESGEENEKSGEEDEESEGEDEEPEDVNPMHRLDGTLDNEEDSEWIMDAAIKHRRKWILKVVGPSDPKSPFKKLPAELLNIILEYCCDSLYDEIGDLDLHVWRLRSQGWDDWVQEEAKDLVWEGVSLAEFLYKKWKLLREAMVKKYEATEEPKKEWERFRQNGEPPYYSICY